jgi:hypothetical protein
VSRTSAIRAEELRATVEFLASDELAGRAVGSEECVRAGEHLAQRLAQAGLKAGGDSGTYLQRVPMRELRHAKTPKLRLVPSDQAPDAARGFAAERSLGLEFEAPRGLLPSGALRLQRATSAAELPAQERSRWAVFLDLPTRERRALEEEIGRSQDPFGLLLLPGASTPGKAAEFQPPPPQRSFGSDRLEPPSLRVRGPLLEDLRAGRVRELELLDVEIESRALPAFNVIGLLEGRGPLAREVIVLSAHYDHIGTRPARKGAAAQAAGPQAADRIHNGADDDASGCALLLELAEALAAGPPPQRTLLFFFATGEEIGLVGTHYYLDNPVRPLAETVCNLNFEMVGRPNDKAGGPGALWLTGDERSNLGQALRGLGAKVVADPYPEQHFFERSDNIAFARRGIVAQTLSSYDLHGDYHEVTDEADRLDYAHLESAAKLALACVQALAQDQIDPAWNPGGAPAAR